MKEIKLTQGYVALVDDEDYEFLNQWKWYVNKNTIHRYAMRTVNIKRHFVKIMMHRLIMQTPVGMDVDHIDHNGLNNQKSNLRNCTHAQNGMNRTACGKTGYLGVRHAGEKYAAAIKVHGKQVHLGTFNTLKEAADAYDEAAMKYHGEYANLNCATK